MLILNRHTLVKGECETNLYLLLYSIALRTFDIHHTSFSIKKLKQLFYLF